MLVGELQRWPLKVLRNTFLGQQPALAGRVPASSRFTVQEGDTVESAKTGFSGWGQVTTNPTIRQRLLAVSPLVAAERSLRMTRRSLSIVQVPAHGHTGLQVLR